MSTPAPEYNVTGIDYSRRDHLRSDAPPLIDVHAHVTRTPDGGLDQAGLMLDVARSFGVVRIYSMCPPEDILPLRERFGAMLGFNGSITRKADDPDDAPAQLLDRFLEQGIEILKFWAAPRGRDRGLIVDAPWRIDAAHRARAAGVRTVLVHVGDPDRWFRTVYTDAAKFGTKPAQYVGLRRMLEEFPDLTWIAAHMGGDPEHPDHLEALLERYPNLHFDTSATKWQVREVSARSNAVRSLICRWPDRFLFGSDLVTRPNLERDHYVSRYWCQRTLWESSWEGQSPIDDPDYERTENGPTTPRTRGLDLPADVLRKVYRENASRLLPGCAGG